MVEIVSTNLTTPLGLDECTCYANIKSGLFSISQVRRFAQEDFTASSFSESDLASFKKEGDCSLFESVVIHSIAKALKKADIDPSSSRVLFILASTKGNIHPLDEYFGKQAGHNISCEEDAFDRCKAEVNLPVTIKKISEHFNNPNAPVVVSNACISGLHAQILAKDLLEAKAYDYVIITGCDLLSTFCLKGFDSLRVLSKENCKPFDMDRNGINLGEAAGTIIFRRTEKIRTDRWYALSGAVRNDAYHIISPSPGAEGLANAIRSTIKGFDKRRIGLINAHGTATLYNDEMEAKAIFKAGLADIPVNSLKGYLGHTMGASGVIEVILSMMAIDDNTIIGTKGFKENGVSVPLNISESNRNTNTTSFLKTISGFGGCNAAMLYSKG